MPAHPVKKNGKVIGWRYGHPGHGHKIMSKAKAKRQEAAININKARAAGHKIPKKRS